MASEDFYVRYYVGHKGKFGHEFLEFEFRPDGKARPRSLRSHPRLSRASHTAVADIPALRAAALRQQQQL
jgi:hypothetical protein